MKILWNSSMVTAVLLYLILVSFLKFDLPITLLFISHSLALVSPHEDRYNAVSTHPHIFNDLKKKYWL